MALGAGLPLTMALLRSASRRNRTFTISGSYAARLERASVFRADWLAVVRRCAFLPPTSVLAISKSRFQPGFQGSTRWRR